MIIALIVMKPTKSTQHNQLQTPRPAMRYVGKSFHKQTALEEVKLQAPSAGFQELLQKVPLLQTEGRLL